MNLYRAYPVCPECEHTLNPHLEDDCAKVYILPNGELRCSCCFRDWLKDHIEENLDDVAGALDIPILYTEGGD